MSLIMFLVASGWSFFVGIGAILAAEAMTVFVRKPWLRRRIVFLLLLGVVLVVLSATPLPYLYYAMAGAVTAAWGLNEWKGAEGPALRRRVLRVLLPVAWLLGVGLEAPRFVQPEVKVSSGAPIHIIGDSISAGVGQEGEHTWPGVLAELTGTEVRNHAVPGATLSSAMPQTLAIQGEPGLIVLEIGGNDQFGGATSAEYERDMDALLQATAAPNRRLVMFEIPLLPFGNGYGLAQRRLAAKYGVPLIPKHVLAGIITTDGATVDGLHLSPTGHRRLAESVFSILRFESVVSE